MKHIRLENALYYVTIVVYDRLPIFTTPSFVIPLLDSLNFYRYKLSFLVAGYVIMPDHLHVLLWPYGDATISEIFRDFKKFTSGRLRRQAEVEKADQCLAAFSRAGAITGRGEHKVWQDNYWDTLVFSPRVMRQKLNYMHRNPVRAGLVEAPEDYPYSSYRNYVQDDQSFIVIDKEWIMW